MYYKIVDKNSKLYKDLYNLRKEELEIERKNKEAIKKVIGSDWDDFLGKGGQQNYWRVTTYSGFAFKNPKNLPEKTWKQHKEYPSIYVPNTRTKNGKKMESFLKELQHSSITKVFSILGCELCGQFTFPFVEIGKDDVIVFYMTERFNDTLRKNKDVIEITSKEFDEILDNI